MRCCSPWTLVLVGLAATAGLNGCDASPASGKSAAREAPRAAELRSAVVREAIDGATRALRTRGYSPAGEERRGFVVERASLVDELPMQSGTCYVALGAASAALTRLELALHDSDGAPVAGDDVPSGARAALRFCPPHSGTYYLAARAAAGNGIVALRVFEGPSGLDVRVDDLFGPPEPAGPAP
jgi:hypothetical protein